jgi:integrase
MHTINQIFDRFEAGEVPGLASRTRADYVRHIRILRKQFGTGDVRELRRNEVVAFITGSKAPIQRNRTVGVLSSALSSAIKWGWAESNVCKGVPHNEPKKRNRQLTLQEFEELRKKAPIRVRLLMDLARLTGQGQGALIAMRWSHVNDERNVILFRQTGTNKTIEVPHYARHTSCVGSVQEDWQRRICGYQAMGRRLYQ